MAEPETEPQPPPGKGPEPRARSQRGLDWLNFFIADVESGFGPFVSLYLSSTGWNQGAIGSVLSVNTVLALFTQPAAGAVVDATAKKRLIVAICLGLIAGAALLIAFVPTWWAVALAEAMQGVTGGAIRTAIAAIGLALVGHRAFHNRVGRNQRYNSLGTAITAGAMGLLGTAVAPNAPMLAAAALCIPAAIALSTIHAPDIDYGRARSSEGRKEQHPASWRELAANRRLMTFAAALFFLQLANASMLPLATERMVAEGRHASGAVTAGLVVLPQLVTAALAGWFGRKADDWGRRTLLLVGFAMLPIRATAFALSADPRVLLAVQCLDGLTAATVGILTPLIVADVTRRSGRFNVALGTVGMIATIGAAISTTASGAIAQRLGFFPAFAALGAAAAIGVAIVLFVMPDTAYESRRDD